MNKIETIIIGSIVSVVSALPVDAAKLTLTANWAGSQRNTAVGCTVRAYARASGGYPPYKHIYDLSGTKGTVTGMASGQTSSCDFTFSTQGQKNAKVTAKCTKGCWDTKNLPIYVHTNGPEQHVGPTGTAFTSPWDKIVDWNNPSSSPITKTHEETISVTHNAQIGGEGEFNVLAVKAKINGSYTYESKTDTKNTWSATVKPWKRLVVSRRFEYRNAEGEERKYNCSGSYTATKWWIRKYNVSPQFDSREYPHF